MKGCLSERELELALEQCDSSDAPSNELIHINHCKHCKERFDAERLFRDLKLVVGQDSRRSTQHSFASTNSRQETDVDDKELPQISGYEIESRISRGGQGVVYRALQKSTSRFVAIKILRQGKLADDDRQLLFSKEVETVASLRHPNIVTLFESGSIQDTIYYSMELVDGFTFDEFIKNDPVAKFEKGRTSTSHIRTTLQIFLKILNAIAYAHRKGVIHRDIKPQNILVDSESEPKILDFGLARIADLIRESDEKTNDKSISFYGTPAYASPEQLAGENEKIDTRSDIYSLGVVLFEALTARFPHPVQGSLSEIAKEVKSQEPVSPRDFNREIDSDVNSILLKMLEKDPEKRYQSAERVIQDIEDYLDGRPIESKKDNRLYTFRKLVRRNWLASYSVLTAFVALVVALIVSTRYYSQAIDDRDQAVRSTDKANKALKEADVQRTEAELQNYIANLAAAAGSLQLYDVVDCTKRLLSIPEKMRGWEWHHFLHYLDDSKRTVVTHQRYATKSRFGRNTNEIISCSQDNKLLVSYADQSQPTREFVRDSLGPLAISPDRNVVAMSGKEGKVLFLRLDELKIVSSIQSSGNRVTTIRYFPDGKSIAIGVVSPGNGTSSNVAIEIWDLPKSKMVKRIPFIKWHINSISISGNQQLLAAITYEGGFILDLLSGNRVAKLPDRPGNEAVIEFSPDGKILATGGNDGVIYLYDSSNGKLVGRLGSHQGKISAARFYSDSKHLITASRDKTVRIWNLERRQLLKTMKGHHWGLSDLDLGNDGRSVVTASWDKSVRLWNGTIPIPDEQSRAHDGQVATIDYSTNGALFASASRDSTVRIWRTHSQRLVRTLKLTQPAHGVEFSHDDKLLATSGWSQPVKIWSTKKWKTVATLDGHLPEARVHSVAFSKDDRWLFTGGSDNRLIAWDAKSFEKVASLVGHDDHIHTVTVSPDNRFLASAGHESIRVWSMRNFELIRVIPRKMLQDDYSLAFHPHKNWLAAGADVGTINIWDVETGEIVATLKGHNDEIKSLDFLPDGSRLVTCSFDNRVIVWDTERNLELLSLFGHSAPPNIVKFDPSGFFLVGGLENGDIKMWKGISIKDLKKTEYGK